jgi:hypothetical protein
VTLNDLEPVRFGFRAKLLVWLGKIKQTLHYSIVLLLIQSFFFLSSFKISPPPHGTERLDAAMLFILMIMLGVLADMTSQTKRCKYNVPELYWCSTFFMFYCFAVVVVLGLVRVRTFIFMDADPGKCNKSCQDKFSANVIILPCGHRPGSKEPASTPPQDSMRMCFACSHLHTECPVCQRLVEDRQKVNFGYYSSFLLAVCCIVQMLIPALNIKWVYQHSACFVRDIPPEEYSNGCSMLLGLLFVLMSIGIMGMQVASSDGRDQRVATWYRFLAACSCVLTLMSGLMFWYYAQPDFNAVSSTEEMKTVRGWGYGSECIREKMLNHAFKGLFGNSCRSSEEGLFFYELFSCTPCDKTSPNSCVDSVRAIVQQEFTGYAAFGFLLRSMADAYGFVCASGVVVYNNRVSREQNARKISKKMETKRILVKTARTILKPNYKCVTLGGLSLGLDPGQWDLRENAQVAERQFNMLLKEVENVVGREAWDPSFFPPGVFQDNDILKFKLLNMNDRRNYMEEVVSRVVMSTESKLE